MGSGAGRNACDLGVERERVFALFRHRGRGAVGRTRPHRGRGRGRTRLPRGPRLRRRRRVRKVRMPCSVSTTRRRFCPRYARPWRRGSEGRGRRGRRSRDGCRDRRPRDRGRDASRHAPRPRDLRSRRTRPSLVLVRRRADAGSRRPQQAYIRGDARVGVIAAASVVAKTARDARMDEMDADFPATGSRITPRLCDARAPRGAPAPRTEPGAPPHLRPRPRAPPRRGAPGGLNHGGHETRCAPRIGREKPPEG